jgi:predicted transcriptional regulator
MSKCQYTIELPTTVGRRVERVARKQERHPSELAVEVFGWYFSARNVPIETPTLAELRAIRRGEAAIKRGDYITLDDLRREEAVARRPRRSRTKVS